MLENKVLNIIKDGKLISNGDKVLVAVSGGPDSICLLDILNKLKKHISFEIAVAHVNHLLRTDAAEDSEYVKTYSEKIGADFYLREVSIKDKSMNDKIGIEEAGRIARYEFFEEIAEKINANKIAVAHNKNDVAETLIMNVLRGSGMNGLKSIELIRGKYIRPLIEIDREEIEAYCEKHNLEPRIDSTNLETTYRRNKVRNIVIPYIQKEFNPNIIEALSRLSKIAKDENAFIEKEAYKKYKEVMKEINKSKIILDVKLFNQQENVIKRRIVLYTISDLFGDTNGIEKVHIEDIIKLLDRNIGNKFLTPNKRLKVSILKNEAKFEVI